MVATVIHIHGVHLQISSIGKGLFILMIYFYFVNWRWFKKQRKEKKQYVILKVLNLFFQRECGRCSPPALAWATGVTSGQGGADD